MVRYHDVQKHPTSDPEFAVIEFAAEREAKDGTCSSLHYVWVVETRDDEIVLLRDYYDSAAALKLVRG